MKIIKETAYRVLVERIGNYWNREWAIYEKNDDGSIGALEFHSSNKDLVRGTWEKKMNEPRWKDTEHYKDLCKSTWEWALALVE